MPATSLRLTACLMLLIGACGDSAKSAGSDAGPLHDANAAQADASSPAECLPATQLVRSGRYLVVGSQPSGLDACGDSWFRREAIACDAIAKGDACAPENAGTCLVDADCSERGRGTCVDDWNRGCFCSYACNTDADCNKDELCLCPSGYAVGADEERHFAFQNECVPATCRTSADCNGKGCVASRSCCEEVQGFFCQTDRDECNTDADCPDDRNCAFDAKRSIWACGDSCTCE